MKILSKGLIKGKDILVIHKTTPDNMVEIMKVKGVIVEEWWAGGLMSHPSIICRELNIPCVQIDNAMEIYKKGNKVQIDAMGL